MAFKPKVTWTDTEITVNVADEIKRKKDSAIIMIIGGFCILWLACIGAIFIVLGFLDYKRDDEGHFHQMKRQWTNIAKNKNMTIKFINFPESLKHFKTESSDN